MTTKDEQTFEMLLEATGSDPRPEWLIRMDEIRKGRKTWDDYSYEERTSRGWQLPILWRCEIGLYGFQSRWGYWGAALLNRLLPFGPIPVIDFEHAPHHGTMKMLEGCLVECDRHGATINDFLHWLLWSFGGEEERAHIKPDTNECWYRRFNLMMPMSHPYDYFGDILSQTKTGWWNNPHKFFPTPPSLVELMFRLNVGEDKDFKFKTFDDPTTGTGRFLLHASNASLFLHGTDIDPVVIKAAKCNGYMYVPWLVINPFNGGKWGFEVRNPLVDPVTEGG